MDFIRHSINAIFYNFPIDLIGQLVADEESGDFLEAVAEVLKWEVPNFTKSEMELLTEAIDKNWCNSEDWSVSGSKDDNVSYPLPLQKRFPLLLKEFTDKVLIIQGRDTPVVRFNDLLRWRFASLNIGEDLFITAWLAERDMERKYERKDFLWPLVIGHDNIRLNAILDAELSDTHAHINASNDIFEFNWLRLMSDPECCSLADKSGTPGKNSSCWAGGARKSYDFVNRYSPNSHSLQEWCVVAAAIRVWLYTLLRNRSCDLSRERIVEAYATSALDYDLVSKVTKEIGVLSAEALLTENGLFLDYAIAHDDFKEDIPRSPLVVNHGERKFLYDWFRAYYGDIEGIRENADLMLMYLIIKAKMRREFIQTNQLIGFGNFQDYNRVKSDFHPKKKVAGEVIMNKYREIVYRYAVQTSLENGGNIHLEARITPGEIESFYKWNYRKSIFSEGDYLLKNHHNPITFVAHFLKSKDKQPSDDGTIRHRKSRKELQKYSDKLISALDCRDEGLPEIVGVDAAGSELNCRPEVFAPFFRYLRNAGIGNFTYHAGEDFYDILDGLRSIDEVCRFMDYRFGDRLGHALALGMDVREYYENRHNNIVIPAQILLDNLVWLKYTAAQHGVPLNPSTCLFIEDNFRQLSRMMGYRKLSTDTYDYFLSMRLRGDLCSDDSNMDMSHWTKVVRFSPVSPKDKWDSVIEKLHYHYEHSKECKMKGDEIQTCTLPQSFAEDVAALQEALLYKLEKRGVVIETNPSSNIKIGRFSRYDCHPIVRFHGIDKNAKHAMMVSINTDDKGIFCTSLKNEYSLIALALRKMKDSEGHPLWTDADIESYLRKIAHYGNISRFRGVT